MHTIYPLLAILEFFVVNWLGRHSIASGYHQITFIQTTEDAPLFDAVFRILAPTVFLVVTAAFWYAVGFDGLVTRYWWVTVYYFAVRWCFNLVMGRFRLLNWWKQLFLAAMAIGLSIWVSERLLINRDAVLPSARGLTDELWIVVIGFAYLTGTRVNWPQLGPPADERKKAYILSRFRKFRRRFGPVIKKTSNSRFAEALSYAILIYENFNRPLVYQLLESAVFFPVGLAHTLGPMQVSTPVKLPARELVRLGVERVNSASSTGLEQAFREAGSLFSVVTADQAKADGGLVALDRENAFVQDIVAERAAAHYNIRSDYPREVVGIFDLLRSTFFPDLMNASHNEAG